MDVKANNRGFLSLSLSPSPSPSRSQGWQRSEDDDDDEDDLEDDRPPGRIWRLRALALGETSAAFAAWGPSSQAAVEAIARQLAQRVAGGCLIRPLAGGGHALPTAAAHGRVRARAPLLALMRTSPEALGSAYCAWVGQRGRSILTPSVSPRSLRRWTDQAAWAYLEASDIVTFLVVPVRSSERVVGTLSLWRERPGLPLGEDEQVFAEEVGRRLVAA